MNNVTMFRQIVAERSTVSLVTWAQRALEMLSGFEPMAPDPETAAACIAVIEYAAQVGVFGNQAAWRTSTGLVLSLQEYADRIALPPDQVLWRRYMIYACACHYYAHYKAYPNQLAFLNFKETTDPNTWTMHDGVSLEVI